MKILVTGAAGFIGGQLWHTLWKRGDEVVGIDNFSYGNPDNLKLTTMILAQRCAEWTSATRPGAGSVRSGKVRCCV